MFSSLLRKFFTYFCTGAILLFYVWLVFAAHEVQLPGAAHPLLFYSNQTRHDIKLTFYKALKKATSSIYLNVYGISDPEIIDLLCKKAKSGMSVTVDYDPSASKNLKKILPASACVRPIKAQGLMHHKIIVVDHVYLFLGSANLTPTSLRHHANLVLGLYSPELAAFLENPNGCSFSFLAGGGKGELFLLPDPKKEGLERLIQEIERAQKEIVIAMFTLTHPLITDCLIRAQKKGVEVCVAIDYYTAKGASKKALESLKKEGVKIYLSQGQQLLHHKWGFIDKEIFVMGSANWTKAAFTKNSDFLLFLSQLDGQQKKLLNHLWEIIKEESLLATEIHPHA